MSKHKGNLSIHSENIFPIIKKWLYSDHDIFIRELISNSCDAITKLKRLKSLGEAEIEDSPEFKVKVVLDSTARTLKFIDNGIGMTQEEVEKYINQIAFSGAEDFLKKYKDKGDVDQIIGHFGLGFYSSFMVSDVVEIDTLSYQSNATAVKWSCDGGTEFEMEASNRTARGTEITLHLGQDGEDFLSEYTVRSTIEKYCSFMPYPIYFEVADKEPQKDKDGNVILEELKPLNQVSPLYLKQPSSCGDDEYKEFYRQTFRDFQEPLFWIHLNMDYPFNLKGILYFPKLNTEFDAIEGRIKLYNNQVFVADNIKEVIPEFLLLLKGVIDCPDLPLNVSRSFLQNDGFVRKISDYITKKVADKLNGLFKTDRSAYEKFWDDISPFVKYGILKDDKFYDKVSSIILYKTTDNKYVTVEEYLENHKEKLDKEIYYTTDSVQQAQYLKILKENDIEAVMLEHSIDVPFVSHMEIKSKDVAFKRVDSDISSVLKSEDSLDEEVVKKETEKLTAVFGKILNKTDVKIKLEGLKSNVAAMIILPENSRRMQEMMKRYSLGGMGLGEMPSEETLVLNKNNSLVQYIIDHGDDEGKVDLIVNQIYDLAVMSHKPLSPEAMTNFIERSNEIMKKVINT